MSDESTKTAKPVEKPIVVTVKRLEVALSNIASSDVSDVSEVVDLIAAAGEATGVLRMLSGFDLERMQYDMVRLAGMAGQYPDDFDKRYANG